MVFARASATRLPLSSVELQFRDQYRLGERDVEVFQQALDEHADGIILAPGHPHELKTWIRKAARIASRSSVLQPMLPKLSG